MVRQRCPHWYVFLVPQHKPKSGSVAQSRASTLHAERGFFQHWQLLEGHIQSDEQDGRTTNGLVLQHDALLDARWLDFCECMRSV